MSAKTTWIGIIVGLLVFSVLSQVVLLLAALNDPSFAVEPDYERKARNWDEVQRQQARNRELDWTVELGTRPAGTPGHLETIVEVYDQWGKPIAGAAVDVVAFHNARAGRRLEDRLRELGDGRYSATLPVRMSGVWEFRVSVRHEEDLFTRTVRKSVLAAPRFRTSEP